MPQISLYIDEGTLEQISQRAKSENISISKWVGNNIKTLIKNQYPDNFFSLFGAIKDETFQKHADLDIVHDSKREEF
jgi:hypothetical protein